MTETADLVLYTDGGAELGKSAAAAAIIEDAKKGSCKRLVCYLGPGTNNEAEIMAGLIGFAALSKFKQPPASIRWVCDSQYVLSSATQYIHNWQRNGWKTSTKQPVKNQGLWRAYLWLADGYSIIAEHVRGHTGHPENEACDFATNWLRANASILDERRGSFEHEIDGETWQLFDGRDITEALREDFPVDSTFQNIIELAAGKHITREDRTVGKFIASLREVQVAGKNLKSPSKGVQTLLKQVAAVIEELE